MSSTTTANGTVEKKISVYSKPRLVICVAVPMCVHRKVLHMLCALQMDVDEYVTSGTTEVRTWSE